MPPHRTLRLLAASALTAAAILLAACGPPPAPPQNTGGKVEPASGAERQILAALDTLPSGQAKSIAGLEVRVEPPYFAASGRECRWIAIKPPGQRAQRRLACKDGGSWFYVPDVLAPPGD